VRWGSGTSLRLDVFHRIDSRCATARTLATPEIVSPANESLAACPEKCAVLCRVVSNTPELDVCEV
jgi:hypothetical protein